MDAASAYKILKKEIGDDYVVRSCLDYGDMYGFYLEPKTTSSEHPVDGGIICVKKDSGDILTPFDDGYPEKIYAKTGTPVDFREDSSGTELKHFGKGHDDNPPGRGSGRYPYGSKNNETASSDTSKKKSSGILYYLTGLGVGPAAPFFAKSAFSAGEKKAIQALAKKDLLTKKAKSMSQEEYLHFLDESLGGGDAKKGKHVRWRIAVSDPMTLLALVNPISVFSYGLDSHMQAVGEAHAMRALAKAGKLKVSKEDIDLLNDMSSREVQEMVEDMLAHVFPQVNELYHYGKGHDDNPPGRGSGRYPYGSKNNESSSKKSSDSDDKKKKVSGGSSNAGIKSEQNGSLKSKWNAWKEKRDTFLKKQQEQYKKEDEEQERKDRDTMRQIRITYDEKAEEKATVKADKAEEKAFAKAKKELKKSEHKEEVDQVYAELVKAESEARIKREERKQKEAAEKRKRDIARGKIKPQDMTISELAEYVERQTYYKKINDLNPDAMARSKISMDRFFSVVNTTAGYINTTSNFVNAVKNISDALKVTAPTTSQLRADQVLKDFEAGKITGNDLGKILGELQNLSKLEGIKAGNSNNNGGKRRK